MAATETPKEEEGEKVVMYKDPKVKIGTGKYGPVDLIIYNEKLHAVKRIPKSTVDSAKRVELVLNEKNILNYLKAECKTSK